MKKHHLYLIGIYILFSMLKGYFYHRYGLVVATDSHRYLEYARHLQEGFYIDRHNIWYLIYVLFIYIIQLFSQAYEYIVLCQLALSYISLYFIYVSGTRLFHNPYAGLLSAVLYISYIDIHQWDFFILAESFYASLTAIGFYILLLLLDQQHTQRRAILYAFPLAFFFFFIKPTAFTFAFPILIIGAYHILPRKWLTLALLIAIIPAYFLLNKMLYTYQVVETYSRGDIVYEAYMMPQLPSQAYIMIQPPHDLYIPSDDMSPIMRMAAFSLHNPVYTLRLTLAKLVYNISNIRPYYTLTHNLINVTPTFIVWILFSLTMLKYPRSPLKTWIVLYIIGQMAIMGLYTAEWDCRFFVPLYPILTIMASYSVYLYIIRTNNKKEST